MPIVDFEQDPNAELGTGNFRDDKGRSMYLSDPETASRFIKTMPGATLGKTVATESSAIANAAMGGGAPAPGPDLRTASNNLNDTGLPTPVGDVRAPVPGVPAAAPPAPAAPAPAPAPAPAAPGAPGSAGAALVGRLEQLPKKPPPAAPPAAPAAAPAPGSSLPVAQTTHSRQVVKGADKGNVLRRIGEEETAGAALDASRTALGASKDARVDRSLGLQRDTVKAEGAKDFQVIADARAKAAEAQRMEGLKRKELEENDKLLDPNAYVKRMSTGKKIGMILLAALNGGFGNMSGQKENTVLSVLNSEIERDIDRQKGEMASGRIRIGNEIDKYVKMGFDAETAEKMARDRMSSAIMLSMKLEAERLGLQGENAENAKFLNEQAELQRAQRRGDLWATTENREQTADSVTREMPKSVGGNTVEDELKRGQLLQQRLAEADAAEVAKVLGPTDGSGRPRSFSNDRAKKIIDGAQDLAVKMPRFEVAQNRIRQALKEMGVPIEAYNPETGVIDWTQAKDLKGIGPIDSRPGLKSVLEEGPIAGVISSTLQEGGVGPQSDVGNVQDTLRGVQEDLTYATTGASATPEQSETFRQQSGQDIKSEDSVKRNLSRTAQSLMTQRNAMLAGDKDATKFYQHNLNRDAVKSLTPGVN